ncbi:MAG: histidine phosphatase family protein [Lachnospiraceae bacterium]|nr:histidine phosphatase family protein [Lachnospiraceae bacterium]
MTTIIFVRHAQADYKEDDRTRDLSREGKKDRDIVLHTLKDRKIDAFLSSPYTRSIETIRPAAEYFEKTIHTDERLRERQVGSHLPEFLEKRWADFSFAEEGGENLFSVQERNIEALYQILDDYENKTVVIGTHGTALSMIINHFKNDFGLDDFLRIVNKMPYIIEMRFAGKELIGMSELACVNK